jgi:hypothetical protein
MEGSACIERFLGNCTTFQVQSLHNVALDRKVVMNEAAIMKILTCPWPSETEEQHETPRDSRKSVQEPNLITPEH